MILIVLQHLKKSTKYTNNSSLSEKMNTYQESRNLDIQNIFKDKPKLSLINSKYVKNI